jgi:hypothetical protein
LGGASAATVIGRNAARRKWPLRSRLSISALVSKVPIQRWDASVVTGAMRHQATSVAQ